MASKNQLFRFLLILLLRTVAAVIFAVNIYYISYYISILFSGQPGTEFAALAAPQLLPYLAAAIGFSALLVFLTILRHVGLKQSLYNSQRFRLAIFVPVIFGLVISAAYISYHSKKDAQNLADSALNENDSAVSSNMDIIVYKLAELPQRPESLAPIDADGKITKSGITYTSASDSYTLCAKFERNNLNEFKDDNGEGTLAGVNFYKHDKGYTCFKVNPKPNL